MPEIKHNFTKGKMNKDLDERLVPNGEYRHAMNIQVATSDGSEVGTVQNILGNKEITIDIPVLNGEPISGFLMPLSAVVVGAISDEKVDTMYYLVWSNNVDYILSYKRGDTSPEFVFVDQSKQVLKFPKNKIITGINVIDGMLFWTDNANEPRKVNIQRCKSGTKTISQTRLINTAAGIDYNSNVFLEEKHITVIKKGPQIAPDVKLYTSRVLDKIYTAVITISSQEDFSGDENDFVGTFNDWFDFSPASTSIGANEFMINVKEALDASGAIVTLPTANPINSLTGWFQDNSTNITSLVGRKVVLQAFDENNNPPGLPLTDFVIKGDIKNTASNGDITIQITTIDGFPQQADQDSTLKYVVDLFEETERLFEFKFPRFSYRYKFDDGEYSTFAPFTQVAFAPGSFDYHPRKGYNLGMTNRLDRVELLNIITTETPSDVIGIDILFKDDSSPSVYVVDTIKPDDYSPLGQLNMWNRMLASSSNPNVPQVGFDIKGETISSIVPSNQLLRPWDNVPKKALAQDITGNRIVYANYTQNYDLISQNGEKYVPNFNITVSEDSLNNQNLLDPSTNISSSTYKSIKSLREYQLGVVFLDKFGRETPVISNASGTKQLVKSDGDKANRFNVQFSSEDYPQSLTHFKFFIKETSSEYYNMAMDRWYSAGDGNIWLAFPSSDRNKIDIDTFLILKKGSDQDTLVEAAARYKVLAIESEAPDFIKTTKRKTYSQGHFSGGAPTKDLFGNLFDVDLPFEGSLNFKMLFTAFYGTSGQDLAVTEDELWVEFGRVGSSQLSKRYKINSCTNSWVPQLGNAPNSGDVLSFELEEPLGSDVNFISDDANGTNPSFIENGAIVTVYKYKTENLDKFDGRFFVKIYFDEVFRNNIEITTIGGGLRVGASQKLYSLRGDLIGTHVTGLDRFLTRGKGRSRSSWGQDWRPQDDGTANLPREQHLYGYYSVDEFAAHATYFRRYREKLYTWFGSTSSGQNDYGVFQGEPYDQTSLNYRQRCKRLNFDQDCRALVHLRDGGTPTGTNYDDGTVTVTSNTNVPAGIVDVISPHIGYKGKYWRDTDDWWKEFGYHTTEWSNDRRNFGTKLGRPTNGLTSMWLIDQSVAASITMPRYYRERPVYYGSDTQSARDTEVWFIDTGKREGESGDTEGNLVFGIGQNKLAGSIGDGLSASTSSWNMDIGFGGLTQTVPLHGENPVMDLWNVGDWNLVGGGSPNTAYTDSPTTTFINNLNQGYRFKWKEDPVPGRVYTIAGSAADRDFLRHSRANYPQNLGNTINSNPNNSQVRKYDQHEANEDLKSMAENLSFNLTKNWDLKGIEPAIGWDPTENGQILGGLQIELKCTGDSGANGNTVLGSQCSGAYGDNLNGEMDLRVFVESISTVDATSNATVTLQEGMRLKQFTREDGSTFGTSRWIVREITKIDDNIFELKIGGYSQPLRQKDHNNLFGVNNFGGGLDNAIGPPVAGEIIKFVQVGMNGYSPNSEFNINTISRFNGINDLGAIAAVGYTIEFIEEIQPVEILSENPAIFETEPKDTTALDIYYEACGSIPMSITPSTISSALPIGTKFFSSGNVYVVTGYPVNTQNPALPTVEVRGLGAGPIPTPSNFLDEFFRPDDLVISSTITSVSGVGPWEIVFNANIINKKFTLPWHNCYSFKNGVESNRIRDNFNLPYISNGVKASTTLEQEYKEEHRQYGLIYSGIYNSTSGVNNLNQFIQAEKITKDVNPIYGSIQKLYSRDSDLVTLCEDKILRIQANKDALFNADGNSNVVATNKVLGQTIPFAGEFGISTNPESFASESYRAYFTDRVRGAVMRLSKDGITPISDAGMKDYFRDNLKNATQLIGSYDDRNDEYNLTIRKISEYSVKIIGEEYVQNTVAQD